VHTDGCRSVSNSSKCECSLTTALYHQQPRTTLTRRLCRRHTGSTVKSRLQQHLNVKRAQHYYHRARGLPFDINGWPHNWLLHETNSHTVVSIDRMERRFTISYTLRDITKLNLRYVHIAILRMCFRFKTQTQFVISEIVLALCTHNEFEFVISRIVDKIVKRRSIRS
jgi:hypothetical protein